MTLAEYLSEKNLSAAEFARQVSSSRQNVSRWAGGRAMPRSGDMLKISNATNGRVTANDFFGITPRPTAKPQPERAA